MSTIKVDTLQTRSGSTAAVTGAGFVATDQIRGNTAANSVTVVAEGGTNTMNLQQGLVKSWINFNGKNTVAIGDSVNVGSLVDRGTGLYTQNFTTSMGNAVFAGAGSAQDVALDADGRNRMVVSEPEDADAAFINGFASDGSAIDVAYATSIICGDLA